MSRPRWMLMLTLLPMAAGAAPMDTVLKALDAEEAAPIERVRLFVERGDVADVYYVDRVRPGRFRLLKNPRQGGPSSSSSMACSGCVPAPGAGSNLRRQKPPG